ncbi:hypothetical protein BSL82_09535 [Tardibacter chloracetimidivorans]|uniref:Uncharacterized protein n=1 Tax=Tardibacter chloracetimidivorans TaxID=1921510 RepID=A0A1L3ZV59_9SPHN|nr:hypothetical protein [Tardibacter chloracetimidivorans]API59522.1 hypothetical protein BSL82_09535 [Tardibacter chloracetimidivorans]
MAYVASNSPTLIAEQVGGAGSVWLYRSADDDATVNGTDYFTNGEALGMKVGDIVLVIDTTTPKGSFHFVSAIDADGNATTGFGAVA